MRERRGSYEVTHHFTERVKLRFIQEKSFKRCNIEEQFDILMNVLYDDFMKHERRKRYRAEKNDWVVIGKVGIYYIDWSESVIRTIVEKNGANVYVANLY